LLSSLFSSLSSREIALLINYNLYQYVKELSIDVSIQKLSIGEQGYMFL